MHLQAALEVVSVVHIKGDVCEREATLECTFAQLYPW